MSGVRRPILFLLVSTGQCDHCGATLSIEYRALQATYASRFGTTPAATSISLSPVQLVVENLGGEGHKGGITAYNFAAPLRHLSPSPTVGLLGSIASSSPGTGGGGTTSSPQPLQQQRVLEDAAEAAGRQVAAVESSCDALLRQLKGLCQQV